MPVRRLALADGDRGLLRSRGAGRTGRADRRDTGRSRAGIVACSRPDRAQDRPALGRGPGGLGPPRPSAPGPSASGPGASGPSASGPSAAAGPAGRPVRRRRRAGVRGAADVQRGDGERDHGRAADDRAVRRRHHRPAPGRGRQLEPQPVREPDLGPGLQVRRLDRGPGRGLPGGRAERGRLPGPGGAARRGLAARAARLRPRPADAGLHRAGVPRAGLDQRPDPRRPSTTTRRTGWTRGITA